MRLEEFSNEWYDKGPLINRLLWYVFSGLFKTAILPSSIFRVFLLRIFGSEVGKGVVIRSGVKVKYPWRLKIGNHTWIGENVWIENLGNVEIGNNCCISQDAMLMGGNHNYKVNSFDLMVGDITIEDCCWVGARCLVAPGVTIGKYSVCGVNSIITKDTLKYGIYMGNPAILVRKRALEH